MQSGSRLRVERLEESILDALDDRAQPHELSLALSGQADGVPAAVVGVAAPFDEASLLERVEEADELAAVELQPVCDRRLRLARPLVSMASTLYWYG